MLRLLTARTPFLRSQATRSLNTSHHSHPSAPQSIGWIDLLDNKLRHPAAPHMVGWFEPLEAMNRNARRPKRANGSSRPVSRHARRTKRRAFGNHRR